MREERERAVHSFHQEGLYNNKYTKIQRTNNSLKINVSSKIIKKNKFIWKIVTLLYTRLDFLRSQMVEYL